MAEFLFAARECFLNLARYRARYVLFLLLIVLSSAAVSFSSVMTASSDEILDEYLPYYAPDGYYISEENVSADLSLSMSDVQSAEKLRTVFRRIELLCSAALITLTAAVMHLNTDFRKADSHIMKLCGIAEITAGLTIGAEMLVLGAVSYTVGIVLGYSVNFALFGFIAPSFMVSVFPSRLIFAAGYSVILLTDAIVTAGFINKLRHD